jgi:hypothetical protein
MTAALRAPVMEPVYMMVSKTIAERRVGSNPTGGTTAEQPCDVSRGLNPSDATHGDDAQMCRSQIGVKD